MKIQEGKLYALILLNFFIYIPRAKISCSLLNNVKRNIRKIFSYLKQESNFLIFLFRFFNNFLILNYVSHILLNIILIMLDVVERILHKSLSNEDPTIENINTRNETIYFKRYTDKGDKDT